MTDVTMFWRFIGLNTQFSFLVSTLIMAYKTVTTDVIQKLKIQLFGNKTVHYTMSKA